MDLSPFFRCVMSEAFISFAPPSKGTIAQLVEQWTENPCVAGSTPAGTTAKGISLHGEVPLLLLGSTDL
jgi:hypothetical protein